MHQTFEQFKEVVEKARGSSDFTFTSEQLKAFYKEQCLKQIGSNLDLVLGFFMKSAAEMSTTQLYDWSVAIEGFFQIKRDTSGQVSSQTYNQLGSDFDLDTKLVSETKKEEPTAIPVEEVKELSKEEKIEEARKNLEKAGLWI